MNGKKKKLYELTGEHQRDELVKLTGLSAGTISGLWQKWHAKGMLTKRGKYYYKLFEEEGQDG
jgi:hypothetical protein